MEFVTLVCFVLVAVLGVRQIMSGKRSVRVPPARQRELLAKYATPYQHMSLPEKAIFEEKVEHFVNGKLWLGAGINVLPEMKVMIGACAAQLLRGFPEVALRHFDRIVVHPDSYRSPRSGRLHQGEVRPQVGVIVISWDDFVHGYARSGDAHNVGLHEMAHALWFENTIINGEDGFLEATLLGQWSALAATEIARIRMGSAHFFRDYAGTNEAEFFAVAVEYFFERSKAMKAALPEIHACLCALLRQDPST